MIFCKVVTVNATTEVEKEKHEWLSYIDSIITVGHFNELDPNITNSSEPISAELQSSNKTNHVHRAAWWNVSEGLCSQIRDPSGSFWPALLLLWSTGVVMNLQCAICLLCDLLDSIKLL